MRRSLAGSLFLLPVLAGGCLPLELLDPSLQQHTLEVPSTPFGTPGPVAPATTVNYPPASTELSVRVDAIGHKILEANKKEIGLQPFFATHGYAQAEVFHQGTMMLHITDSLVKQCKTEAELAAVLALELARMVAEREVMAHPRTRAPERLPPPEVIIGNAAQVGAFDAGRMAELAHYDRERREAGKPLPPPDPQRLAAMYLEKAGYPANSLEAVQPLLQAAEQNYVLEKHFKMCNQTP